MRIAHIAPTFPPDKGGMGNAAYHMAVEGMRMGCDVTVFTPRYTREAEALSFVEGVRIVRVKPVVQYGKAAFVPKLFQELNGFDLLHLHYPFFGGAETVWLFRKLHKKSRLVISYHMDVVGTGLKAGVFSAYTRLLLRPIISSADRVIVSSCDYAVHSYIHSLVKPEDMREIPFGVIEDFSPGEKDPELMKRLSIAEDELVILFVGSFEYFKGIDRLLSSIPRLKGKFKVLVVGDGGLMPFFKKMAADLGVADRTCFPGFVDEDVLAKYYNLCDIFILPSLDRTEAFGIALIEAMACGKPVISSDLPGVRTVIDDGENGFLVEPGNVSAVSEKLQVLLDREDLRRKFGMSGAEKVAERYRWPKVGEALKLLYSELVPL